MAGATPRPAGGRRRVPARTMTAAAAVVGAWSAMLAPGPAAAQGTEAASPRTAAAPPAATAPRGPDAPARGLAVVNARLFDGRDPVLKDGVTIVLQGNRIASVGREAPPAGLPVVDAGGRVVIPGLIDAHAHPTLALGLQGVRDADPAYATLRAATEARKMLYRGFTTIRDVGGPAFGLQRAIDEGLVEGPRIFPSGAIVSQTSGHGDMRQRVTPSRRLDGVTDDLERLGYTRTADGPDEVLTAVREQLRLGATQIKIAAGGGISSAFDPIDSVQYTADEVRAAVQAAGDWGTYVTVHAYTPIAIRRSIEAGVKCIEHAHLIDEQTMKLIAERGVFLSPQAFLFGGGYAALAPRPAAGAGGPPRTETPAQAAQRAKGELVGLGLDRMMQLAKKYRVKVAFGGDFFGAPMIYAAQSREFGARLKWFTPAEILQQATGVNGELLALSGQRNPYPGRVGVIEPGAMADLLVVDGNPLEDIRVLEEPEKNLRLIVKDGRVVKGTL